MAPGYPGQMFAELCGTKDCVRSKLAPCLKRGQQLDHAAAVLQPACEQCQRLHLASQYVWSVARQLPVHDLQQHNTRWYCIRHSQRGNNSVALPASLA